MNIKFLVRWVFDVPAIIAFGFNNNYHFLIFSSKEASTDDNHNSKANSAGKAMETRSLTAGSNSGSEDESSVTTAVDANMASEEEEAEAEIDESMKDC